MRGHEELAPQGHVRRHESVAAEGVRGPAQAATQGVREDRVHGGVLTLAAPAHAAQEQRREQFVQVASVNGLGRLLLQCLRVMRGRSMGMGVTTSVGGLYPGGRGSYLEQQAE